MRVFGAANDRIWLQSCAYNLRVLLERASRAVKPFRLIISLWTFAISTTKPIRFTATSIYIYVFADRERTERFYNNRTNGFIFILLLFVSFFAVSTLRGSKKLEKLRTASRRRRLDIERPDALRTGYRGGFNSPVSFPVNRIRCRYAYENKRWANACNQTLYDFL